MSTIPHRLAIAVLTAVIAATPAVAARAAAFNPNSVLDDATLRRPEAMSYADIRAFLQAKGGLADLTDIDPVDGLLKNGAQIIADAAARYDVNPQYLLALIQKESSAVETDAPNKNQLEWATGYALCDGCYKSASLAQKYRGFARQVDAGAGWVKWFYDNAANGTSLRKPGETYVISNRPVTPQNVATAALYSYTPHLHGNLLLWTIFNRWFGDGSAGITLPDGSLARDTKTGAVALVQAGKYRLITSPSVLSSRFAGVVPVEVDHAAFEEFVKQQGGRPVRFSDLSLVRVEDGTVYLLVGEEKRRIVSPAAFAKIGFNPEEVEAATLAELEDYRDGEPLTGASETPVGELLQDAKTGGVYLVENGQKRPLLDRAVLTANFPGQSIRRVASAELVALPTGTPVLFEDGVLVKAANDPAVYAISGGKKRAIVGEDVFLTLGYRWSAILTTTKKMLDLHPAGTPLTMEALFGAIVSEQFPDKAAAVTP